ncbi:MAG: hypothetical protein ACRC9L_08395 [Brevinema sp.]
MAHESKHQEMQRRLNVQDMDHSERAKMFNKLKEAGGQIIDLDKQKAEAAAKAAAKLAPKPSPSRPSRPKPMKMKRPPQQKPVTQEDANSRLEDKVKIDRAKPKYPSGFQVLGYRMNIFLSWIVNFSAQRFRPRYISLVMSEYQNAVLSISTMLAPLYNETPESRDFRNRMYTSGNLMEYELGYYFYHLFENQKFSNLQRPISQGVKPAKDHIKALFSSLYRLRLHTTYSKVAISNLLRRFAESFPTKASKSSSAKQVSKWMEIVWDKFFLETNQLVLYYWTEDCHKGKSTISLDRYLGVENLPKIGALAEEWETTFKTQEIIDADIENASEEDIALEEEEELVALYPSENVKEGIEFIMKSILFEGKLHGYQSGNDLRALFKGDDKIFYTYTLIDFFDAEFSPLWSGNLLNFYVVNDRSGARYDPKKELIAINSRINQFYEQVNEYLRQLRSFRELRNSSGSGSQRLLQLENKEKDLTFLSHAARTTAAKLLEEYLVHIGRVLSSREAIEPLISNWSEELPVTKTHRKTLAGVSVVDALTLVAQYLEAAQWLLSKSDLSGRGNTLIKPVVFSIIASKQKKNA